MELQNYSQGWKISLYICLIVLFVRDLNPLKPFLFGMDINQGDHRTVLLLYAQTTGASIIHNNSPSSSNSPSLRKLAYLAFSFCSFADPGYGPSSPGLISIHSVYYCYYC